MGPQKFEHTSREFGRGVQIVSLPPTKILDRTALDRLERRNVERRQLDAEQG